MEIFYLDAQNPSLCDLISRLTAQRVPLQVEYLWGQQCWMGLPSTAEGSYGENTYGSKFRPSDSTNT